MKKGLSTPLTSHSKEIHCAQFEIHCYILIPIPKSLSIAKSIGKKISCHGSDRARSNRPRTWPAPRLRVFRLSDGQRLLLGTHDLGHPVVGLHGAHPHADASRHGKISYRPDVAVENGWFTCENSYSPMNTVIFLWKSWFISIYSWFTFENAVIFHSYEINWSFI